MIRGGHASVSGLGIMSVRPSVLTALLVLTNSAVHATGPQTLSELLSSERLRGLIKSSRPSDVDPEFDCAWREYAMEYAPSIQPKLTTKQHNQLFYALELASLCNHSSYKDSTFPALIQSQVPQTPAFGDSDVVFFVDADHGSDTAGDGSLDKPFATLQRAVAATRNSRALTTSSSFSIQLRNGTYRLSEPVELTEEDSGLSIAGYLNETATITGALLLGDDLNWVRSDDPTLPTHEWQLYPNTNVLYGHCETPTTCSNGFELLGVFDTLDGCTAAVNATIASGTTVATWVYHHVDFPDTFAKHCYVGHRYSFTLTSQDKVDRFVSVTLSIELNQSCTA